MRSRDWGRRGFHGDIATNLLEGLIGVTGHRLFGDDGPFPFLDKRRWNGRRVDSESSTEDDGPTELLEVDALARVWVEDLSEDGVQFVREWKDRLKKVGVAKVSRVCLIPRICPLPWVASTSEVD